MTEFGRELCTTLPRMAYLKTILNNGASRETDQDVEKKLTLI
jgi:hypothetical protein